VSLNEQNQHLAEQRRAEIAEGALPLFHEKGFHGTSIREIAAAAGLSMGGLYEYIRSKDDVLSLVYRQMTSPFTAAPIGQPPTEAGHAALVDLITNTLSASWERSRDVQILYRETVHIDATHREQLAAEEAGHARVIADAITAGVDRGEFQCEEPLLVGHLVLFLAAFMPLRGWITRRDGIEPSEETARIIAELVVSGIRRP
jgi:AcrR family transcriptional regulator